MVKDHNSIHCGTYKSNILFLRSTFAFKGDEIMRDWKWNKEMMTEMPDHSWESNQGPRK